MVAQLDRVAGYEPVGRGFESSPSHHLKDRYLNGLRYLLFFYFYMQNAKMETIWRLRVRFITIKYDKIAKKAGDFSIPAFCFGLFY
ncbi:MAG: hypothetical protein H6Q58_797 [Firmicutes bacterium]|nr:hypothetical protein [Bacillota bacterium]